MGELFASSNPGLDSSKGNDGEFFQGQSVLWKDKISRRN